MVGYPTIIFFIGTMSEFTTELNKCAGTVIIIRLPRKEALTLLTSIRGLYGPTGSFLNLYSNEITYLAFSRTMPFINELISNDKRYEVWLDAERHLNVGLR